MRAISFSAFRRLLALWVLALGLVGLSGTATAQPGVRVPMDAFYDELAPYGRWLNNPQYGQVWVPDVGPDFQPYASDGRWIMTEYGNTWESDYPWGWAPFHYGRWWLDDFYGWVWVPGDEWAPAWVTWRSGGGYYGWAPLAPGLRVNVQINLPWRYWTFVPQGYLTYRNPYRYCVPRPRIVNVYQSTTIINNYYGGDPRGRRSYAYGPSRQEIERVTRQRVPVYRADDLGRRSGGYARSDNRYDRPGADWPTRADNPRDRWNNDARDRWGTPDRREERNDRPTRPDRFDRSDDRTVPNAPGSWSRGDRPGVAESPAPSRPEPTPAPRATESRTPVPGAYQRGSWPTERPAAHSPAAERPAPRNEPDAPAPGSFSRGRRESTAPSAPDPVRTQPAERERMQPGRPERVRPESRPEVPSPTREVPAEDRGRRSRVGA
jgi:hypothetical protein